MPSKKGKGVAPKRKAPVHEPIDEEDEDWSKIALWDMQAWRRRGHRPYDAGAVATRAEVLGKHTPAVMIAPKPTSSSSSSSSSSFYRSPRPTLASPFTSHLLLHGPTIAPKPAFKSKNGHKSSALAASLSFTPSVASFFSPSSASVIRATPSAPQPLSHANEVLKLSPAPQKKMGSIQCPVAPTKSQSRHTTADSALRHYHGIAVYENEYIAGHCCFEALGVSNQFTRGLKTLHSAKFMRTMYVSVLLHINHQYHHNINQPTSAPIYPTFTLALAPYYHIIPRGLRARKDASTDIYLPVINKEKYKQRDRKSIQ